jgi:hypothetical protein
MQNSACEWDVPSAERTNASLMDKVVDALVARGFKS